MKMNIILDTKTLLFKSFLSFPLRLAGGVLCLFGLLLYGRVPVLVCFFLALVGIVIMRITIEITYESQQRRLIKYFKLLVKVPLKTTCLSEDIESIQVVKVSFDVAYHNPKSGLHFPNYISKNSYVNLFILVNGDKVVIQHFFNKQDAMENAVNISEKLGIPVESSPESN